jgi:hypothetical protein
MPKAIRLGLALFTALAFTPVLASYPGTSRIGSDNDDVSGGFPPAEQVQSSQQDDMQQATTTDDQSDRAGAASGEPEKGNLQWRESPFRDNN